MAPLSSTDNVLNLPSGWLYKWTNYLKGYRKRWFVLENGLFSYYSNANAVSHTCMGTIDLTNVTIISKSSSTSFVLREARGRSYHLKAPNEQDKHRWLAALISAKSKLVRDINGLESDNYSDDLNFYSSSRRSTSSNKLTPNNGGSSWRYFRPFLRRNRQPISIVSASEDSVATDSTAPEVVATCLMGTRPPVVAVAVGERAPNKSDQMPTLPNGSRSANKTVPRIQNSSISSSSISVNRPPHRRRCTLNTGATSELRVTKEFQHHLTSVDSTFDNMVNQANHVFSSIGGIISTFGGDREKDTVVVTFSKLVDFQSSISTLVQACQKTMMSWTTSTQWFQRRLAEEYDKSSHLERTIEQLAKQHRALEAQFYSSYTSLTSNRPTCTLSPAPHSPSSTAFQREGTERLNSISSLSDVFYDAESNSSSGPGHTDGGGFNLGDGNGSIMSFASLGSLRNVDESSGSEEDELVTAAVEEGIFPGPGGRTAFTANSTRTPTPTSTRTIEEDGTGFLEGFALNQGRQRRTSIPPRPRISLNLWGVLKNCIGKELSRIPLPVNFNEPLSFLQRVTEDLTYSRCLDEAAKLPGTDAVGRMAWISAFSVSCYATTAVRMSKPFNPLLGETYECDRSADFGWRSFAEQVSHHPPVVAHYCESTCYGWKFWQEFTVNSKFRGKYLSLIPKGGTHLVFKDGQHYTWSKVTITVHNIIVGRLWAEIHGETVIKNHTTNHTCRMRYEGHSFFSRDLDRQVSGLVYDPSGTLVYKVSGTWDNQIEGCTVSSDGTPTGPPTLLMVVEPLPPNSESMYNFNQFAIELNEPEEGVAPTDSRIRPDQRLMELGRWDEANVEKERLEVKQRRKRRAWNLYETGQEPLDPECGLPYTPVWFSPIHDAYFDEDCHEFNGTYWEAKARQDWSKCPDIF